MDGYDEDLSIVECPLSEDEQMRLEWWMAHTEDPIDGYMNWLMEA